MERYDEHPALSVQLSSADETEDSGSDADSGVLQPGAKDADARDRMRAMAFPAAAFSKVVEGLNKLPTWTVFPAKLAECIRATAHIKRSKLQVAGSAASELEEGMAARVVREVIGQAFCKCCEDAAVLAWQRDTQQDILTALLALAELAAQQLHVLAAATDAEELREAEADSLAIFGELGTSWDPGCAFHQKNAAEPRPLPPRGAALAEERPCWAAPAGGGAWEGPAGPPPARHAWLAFLLDAFGDARGFELLCLVLEQPERLSIALLDALLAPVVKAEELLLPGPLAPLAAQLQRLLAFLEAKAADDLEHLADGGRDRMFVAASSLLERCFALLAKCLGPAAADAAVGAVQRALICRLLAQGSFSKHLGAVRETNSLLTRALALREADGGRAVKVAVDWMRDNDVVKHLLRANLHQKQYVDQVQKVLRNLTIEGGLQEDHLDLLWNLTEKVDTFEAVKNNVLDMLTELAQDLGPPQLDALFGRLQACAGAPGAAPKVMDLMRRLAQADAKGVMAKRVMSLLWRLTMDPGAPAEVSRSPAMTDALQAYADRKGLADAGIGAEYMRQCVAQIQAGTAVPAAMGLLQRLARPPSSEAGWPEGNEALRLLEKEFGVMDAALTSLEAWQEEERRALGGREDAAHEAAANEYAHFLLNVPVWGHLPISWQQAERIWAALVAAPACPSDRHLGLQLLFWQQQHLLLAGPALARLLTERLAGVDVASLSPRQALAFWQLLSRAFTSVAVDEGKLLLPQPGPDDAQVPPPQVLDLDLTGLPTMWRMVLDAGEAAGALAAQAQAHLVMLYTCLSPELEQRAAAVRSSFLETCLKELLPAARLLTGAGPDAPGEAPPAGAPQAQGGAGAAARRAARCLALLQDLIAACQGRAMPARPMHAAAFQGLPARVEVQASAPRQPARFRHACHGNQYLGQLRGAVAARLGAAPEHVRLFAFGRELVSDARLAREEGLGEGAVLMVALSPHANAYTRQAPEAAAAAEAAAPTSLLALSPWLHGALLALAEARRHPAVRANALRLLEALPTDARLLARLRAALAAGPEAVPQLSSLLCGPDGRPSPAPLLYTLQALTAALFPSEGDAPEAQDAFVRSGCVAALLLALRALQCGSPRDVGTVRALHQTAQLLVNRLQPLVARGEPADEPMEDAPQPAAAAASPQAAGEPPDSPIAAVTVTLEEAAEGKAPPDVPAELALFHLSLAAQAAAGWREPDQAGGAAEELADADAAVHAEALAALKQLLELQPRLLPLLLASPRHQQGLQCVLLGGLLSSSHEAVRAAALRFGERVAQLGGGEAHAALLGLLRDTARADAAPAHCGEYYRLLCELVRGIPASPQPVRQQELGVAQALLEQLVAAAPGFCADGEGDGRLEGKLCLLAALVAVLDSRQVGSPGSGDLVRRVLTEFLFPESWFLASLGGGRRLRDVPPGEVAAALHARCSTRASRKAALDLLGDLMAGHAGNARAGMELICTMHLARDVISDDKVNYAPRWQPRRAGGFVGLRNAGATCYMNSVFQQLFLQPSIRRLLLAAPEAPPEQQPDCVFSQLQCVFANLALSGRDAHRPLGFWRAFKDYDGQPINVREHQDAYEFFTRLQDCADQHLRDARQRPAMQAVMGGKFAQQIICRSVPHRSEKQEDFYQISLDVRGKRTLEESLDFYCQGELMEGDNQYLCEELGRKVDAVKRICIKQLPHMLVVHLKRFEYDYETMNRWKIKDRFEFPQELDMRKYTVEGLEAREAAAAAGAAAGAGAAGADAPMGGAGEQPSGGGGGAAEGEAQCRYELQGIVVHSGSAFAGHYYSYIKVRGEAGRAVPNAGRWFCFDDASVEPWDVGQLDADCFGGSYQLDGGEPLLPGAKEYDRPNSAYMLFYERCGGAEPADCPEPAEPAAAAAAAAAAEADAAAAAPMATSSPASEAPAPAPAPAAAEAAALGGGLSTLPIPDVARSVPTLYEDILTHNLQLAQEQRLLDRDYFSFLLALCRGQAEAPAAPPHSMRRTEPSPSSGGSSGRSRGGGGGGGGGGDSREASPSASAQRREADSDRAAERLANLAGLFVLRVLLRSSAALREEQEAWGALLLGLCEASAAANAWLLGLLFADPKAPGPPHVAPASQDNELLENFLVWSMLDDASALVARLLSTALRLAVTRDGGAVSRAGLQALQPGGAGWAAHHALLAATQPLRGGELLRANCCALGLFNVLRDYANLGPAPREHLHCLDVAPCLVACLESAEERGRHAEVAALFEALLPLVRSTDFNAAMGLPPEPRNPCMLPDPAPAHGSKELLAALTSGAPAEILLWLHLLMQTPAMQHLLECLLWQSQGLTMEWLAKLPTLWRKLPPDQISLHSRVLVRLIAVRDVWRCERVKLALCNAHGTGLLQLAAELAGEPSPPAMAPARRLQLARLVLLLLQAAPEAYAPLAGLGQWGELAEWLEAAAELPVGRHPDFPPTRRLMRGLLAGGRVGAAAADASEGEEGGEDAATGGVGSPAPAEAGDESAGAGSPPAPAHSA